MKSGFEPTIDYNIKIDLIKRMEWYELDSSGSG
jgi:hypothetical protein